MVDFGCEGSKTVAFQLPRKSIVSGRKLQLNPRMLCDGADTVTGKFASTLVHHVSTAHSGCFHSVQLTLPLLS